MMDMFTSCLLLNVISCVSAATIYPSVKSTEVGSIANRAGYLVRDPFYSLNDASVNRAASDHFQIIWGNADTTGTVNRQFVQGNLENMESIRLFFIQEMGLKDIGRSQDPLAPGTFYKMNVYIATTGLKEIYDDWAYMGVDKNTFGYVVMMPGAMRVDPPSWVVPHELAHAYIFHNGGVVPYVWNEAVANFLRNEYLGSKYYSYGGTVYGPTADFFAPYVLNSEVHFPHVKNWYDAWPIFLYINENPDNIKGLGHQALLDILTYKKEHATYFISISNVAGVSIKEILGGLARRMVTVDFKAQKYYLKSLEELLQNQENSKKIYTTLTNQTDGWMVVPANKAPQQAGYNIVPLSALSNKAFVTVNFQGTSTENNADWRVSIVTVENDGVTRYSSMWNKGSNTMNLRGDEKAVYLVVAATPNSMPFIDIHHDGVTYPYKVQVTSR